MVFRMKTTLVISDPVFRDLKRQAAQRGTTMSELAGELLRKGLAERPKPARVRPPRSFDMGKEKVNFASRDALYETMESD
jgi:hypothetical protein